MQYDVVLFYQCALQKGQRRKRHLPDFLCGHFIQILLKFHKWFEKLHTEMENLPITH